MAHVFFITGTDTNVGKTVLSVLLTRELLRRGVDVRAVKPLCSGGREDAEALLTVLLAKTSNNQHRTTNIDGIRHPVSGIDQINPWHFAEPLTPMVASRRAGKPLRRKDVLKFLRDSAADCDVLLVEGAGGLLSPLGEDFDARDLIVALRATPVIVTQNRLGAINQSLLVMGAFTASLRPKAQLVLMQPPDRDVVTKTNADVLRERLGAGRVHLLPRLDASQVRDIATTRVPGPVTSTLRRLIMALGL